MQMIKSKLKSVTEVPYYLYSGTVQNGDKDLLWVRIQSNIDDGKTLLIQSTSDYPVKMELRLTMEQTSNLYICLHNALLSGAFLRKDVRVDGTEKRRKTMKDVG